MKTEIINRLCEYYVDTLNKRGLKYSEEKIKKFLHNYYKAWPEDQMGRGLSLEEAVEWYIPYTPIDSCKTIDEIKSIVEPDPELDKFYQMCKIALQWGLDRMFKGIKKTKKEGLEFYQKLTEQYEKIQPYNKERASWKYSDAGCNLHYSYSKDNIMGFNLSHYTEWEDVINPPVVNASKEGYFEGELC